MFKVWVLKKYSFEKEHAGDKQTVIHAAIDTQRWALPLAIGARKNPCTWSFDICVRFLCFSLNFAFFRG